jgi:hypothetical protein
MGNRHSDHLVTRSLKAMLMTVARSSPVVDLEAAR